MNRKYLFYFAVAFYGSAFLILYLSPGAVDTLRSAIYNADLLFPFSVYQGIFTPGSRPDWVFGGYTPVLEVLLGLLFWTLTRNIHLTFALYWLCQPIIITACLLFLARQIYGKNRAVAALVLVFSALPILVFATNRFFHLYYQFVWYGHIGTAYFGLLGLGLLIRFVTCEGKLLKGWGALLSLCAVVILAVLSDALFITQFIAPALAALVLLVILSVAPFRKAAVAGLGLLYATAGGLALYQIPTLWGSQRFGLYGSYMRPALDQIPQNALAALQNFNGFWSGFPWLAGIWAGFYLACLGLAAWAALAWRRQQRMGSLRKRQIAALLFFPLQMAANLGAGLITSNTELRYFQPLIFIPLFWGWPFVLAALPGLIGWLRGRRALISGAALASVAALLLVINGLTIRSLPNLADYYPSFVACTDENTSRLGLKRGIAHYWQARTLTLLNKTGIRLVQATPDLEPFRVLNNSDGYTTDQFDFIIIDHGTQLNYLFDQAAIIQRFGAPAATFTCEQSDFLVYNRPGDTAFRNQFEILLKTSGP